jgi:hypothetical protein
VFVANAQGLLSTSATAMFDENVLIEINIGNNGDIVEDLAIQAISRDRKMYFFGPTIPTTTVLNSAIETMFTQFVVDIPTYNAAAII